MTRRTHSLNAYESDVPSGAGDTGDITVTSALGLTAAPDDGMYLVISPEDVDNREYIKVTSVDVGSGLLGCAADRGLGGSVGGIAHTHPANAKVRAVSVHQWLDDIFDDIGDIDILLGNHIPGVDPHPQYLEEDEGNLLYLSRDGTTPPTADMPWNAKKITGIADGTLDADAVSKLQMETADGVVAGDAATALTTHIDDPADPHSAAGYLVSTDVVNVYLPLAGGAMLDTIDMQANKILDVGLPTLDGDAANKKYVDDEVAGVPVFSGSHDDLSGVSTSDHHVKYTDAEAVDANLNQHIILSSHQANPPNNPGGGFVTGASKTIDIPADWGRYSVVARGSAQYGGNIDGAQLEARVVINASPGPLAQSANSGADGSCISDPVWVDDNETADPCIVKIEVKDNGTHALNVGKYANLDIVIARVT